MKIVRINGDESASVILTGDDLLNILPPEALDILEENGDADMDEIGLGTKQKYVITTPFHEIENTPEAIKKSLEL